MPMLVLADAQQFLVALEQSAMALAVRQSAWAYPAANVGHIVALTIVLRSAGIVPQNAWDSKNNRPSKMLPVSCAEIPNGWGVTLSNDLFEEYRRRGFSRSAVCLALGGTDVHFDPQKWAAAGALRDPGRHLRSPPGVAAGLLQGVEVIQKGGYLVACRPTGCTIRFHPSTGLPIKNAAVVEVSAGGAAGGRVDEDNRSSTVSRDRARALVRGR
jgi:hypothetical protein